MTEPSNGHGFAASVFITMPETSAILGVSRKDDHDDWGLPGGKVNRDEDPKAGAARECLEETGVWVERESLMEIFRGPARTPGRIMIVYRPFYWAGEPESKEGSAVQWIRWSDLERGSFGDFHRVFHRVFDLREKVLVELEPLLLQIVKYKMLSSEVEEAAAERFGLSTYEAIRLVNQATLHGTLLRGSGVLREKSDRGVMDYWLGPGKRE